MEKPVLVVLAAGMGSRYGGMKQLDPVGPGGQIIIDYSIFDARRAGFEKVIFIIRKENEAAFREVIGDRLSHLMEVEYAFQSLEDLPAPYAVPEGRTKPFGTGQAVLSARHLIHGPFAVINADDYYGPEAFQVIYDYLSTHAAAPVYTATKCAYYPMGQNFFESFLQELQKARRFIFLEYFIIQEGRMWNETLKILKRKAAQGVDVRVIFDGIGSLCVRFTCGRIGLSAYPGRLARLRDLRRSPRSELI